MDLINSNKIRILSAFDLDEKYTCGKSSDFELFSLWERMLSLADGTDEARAYEELLSSLSLSYPKYPRTKTEEFSRWRVLCCDELYGDEPFVIRNECVIDAFLHSKREIYETVELDEWVSKNIIKCGSFEELANVFIRDAVNNNMAYISLEIRGYSALSPRPNIYLAQKAFEKIKCGEFYNNDKIILAIELLIILSASESAEEGIFILLDGKGNMDMAEDILPYLCERSLFEGKILLKIDNEKDADRFLKLSDSLQKKIKIYPFLFGDEEALDYLRRIYPEKAMYRYFKNGELPFRAENRFQIGSSTLNV